MSANRRFSEKRKTAKPQVSENINIIQELDALEEQLPDILMAGIYSFGIKKAKSSGFDTTQKCSVCNTSGCTFADYPILKNNEFLRQHHKKFCNLCNQLKRKTAEAMSSSQQPVFQVQSTTDVPGEDDYDDLDDYSEEYDDYDFL